MLTLKLEMIGSRYFRLYYVNKVFEVLKRRLYLAFEFNNFICIFTPIIS